MKKRKKSKEEILIDSLIRLMERKEHLINRRILPLDKEIEELRKQVDSYYINLYNNPKLPF